METNHPKQPLTAAEISSLWTAYLNDSGAICNLEYEINKAEDQDIKEILQFALHLSYSHINKITNIFNEEKYPIPHGFKLDEDVDINAPRLFTDVYFINMVNQLGKIGLNNYSIALTTVTRDDVYSFFKECLDDSNQLLYKSNQVLLEKGIYLRPPGLPTPPSFDYVKKQNFLNGFFGDKRPLTGVEITNLFANFQRNALGAATMMGYSQVSKDKEVVKFFNRGKEIAIKHCEIFANYLNESDLPSPISWGAEVTDSKAFTYSDKKMMFFASSLISLSIGYYGGSISSSPRRDIGLMYSRLIAELLNYANDGAEIMIKHGWMEEPPRAWDREELSKNN